MWLAWNHQSGATVPVPESTRILTQATITTPKSSANHHEYLVQIYHRLAIGFYPTPWALQYICSCTNLFTVMSAFLVSNIVNVCGWIFIYLNHNFCFVPVKECGKPLNCKNPGFLMVSWLFPVHFLNNSVKPAELRGLVPQPFGSANHGGCWYQSSDPDARWGFQGWYFGTENAPYEYICKKYIYIEISINIFICSFIYITYINKNV